VADHARARRLGVRIREIVASALGTEVKDPRLGMVTITDVRVGADLRDATIFYTVYGDDLERAESAAALESAKREKRPVVLATRLPDGDQRLLPDPSAPAALNARNNSGKRTS